MFYSFTRVRHTHTPILYYTPIITPLISVRSTMINLIFCFCLIVSQVKYIKYIHNWYICSTYIHSITVQTFSYLVISFINVLFKMQWYLTYDL